MPGGFGVDLGDGGVGGLHLGGAAAIHSFAHGQAQGQLAQQRHAEAFGQRLAAVLAENGLVVAAAAANVHRHVFQHAENGDVDFAEHVHGFARVDQGDVLRGGNHDGAGNGDFLRQGELDIAGAGRQVDEQVVHIVPFALKQQLLQGLAHHGAAPHHGLVGVDQKADRHYLDAFGRAHGDEMFVFLLRFALGHAEHGGLAGAVEVGIENAHARAHVVQRYGEVGGGGGFAHAAFAGGDGDDVFHAADGAHAGLDFAGGDFAADVGLHVVGATGFGQRGGDVLLEPVGNVADGKAEAEFDLQAAGGLPDGLQGMAAADGEAAVGDGDGLDGGAQGVIVMHDIFP